VCARASPRFWKWWEISERKERQCFWPTLRLSVRSAHDSETRRW